MRLLVIPHITPELVGGMGNTPIAQDLALWCNKMLHDGRVFGAIIGALPTTNLSPLLLQMGRGLGAITSDNGQAAIPEGGRTIISFWLPPDCIEASKRYLEQFPQWLELQRELPAPGVTIYPSIS